MKTIKTPDGWREVTTKVFFIETLGKKPFMSVCKWIESSKRIGLYRKRKKCSCCKIPWEEMNPDGDLFLVFTDKGNKTICSDCHAEFSTKTTNESI